MIPVAEQHVRVRRMVLARVAGWLAFHRLAPPVAEWLFAQTWVEQWDGRAWRHLGRL